MFGTGDKLITLNGNVARMTKTGVYSSYCSSQ